MEFHPQLFAIFLSVLSQLWADFYSEKSQEHTQILTRIWEPLFLPLHCWMQLNKEWVSKWKWRFVAISLHPSECNCPNLPPVPQQAQQRHHVGKQSEGQDGFASVNCRGSGSSSRVAWLLIRRSCSSGWAAVCFARSHIFLRTCVNDDICVIGSG